MQAPFTAASVLRRGPEDLQAHLLGHQGLDLLAGTPGKKRTILSLVPRFGFSGQQPGQRQTLLLPLVHQVCHTFLLFYDLSLLNLTLIPLRRGIHYDSSLEAQTYSSWMKPSGAFE